MALRPSRSGSSTIFHPLIEHQPAGDEVVAGRFHFGGASHKQLRWSTTASWVGDSVTAARGTLTKTTRASKGTDGQQVGAIAFLKHVFMIAIDRNCVPTPQNLSVTKQHQKDR